MDLEIEASKAKRILEDEYFVKSVTELEQVYVDNWRKAETTEEREYIWMKRKALMEMLMELKLPILTLQLKEQQKK